MDWTCLFSSGISRGSLLVDGASDRRGPKQIEHGRTVIMDGGTGIKTGEPARLTLDVASISEFRPPVLEFIDSPSAASTRFINRRERA